ncbi:sugar transferase [Sporosarcina sp. UB5]|uniref:sugar transferase n=1 Tax=Sporosarcina sp. UB5 TaxID=3047463 RepID=UPI003D7BF40C
MERDSHQRVEMNPIVIQKDLFRKRLFDIIASTILIVCCIPLFLILPVLIVINSGRPVFFTQSRTGRNHEQFTIIKFRTMKQTNNDGNVHKYNWNGGVPDDFVFKSSFDSKVTPIGKVLRKYSLDEVPQLFNVLLGSMSMVGPRPEIPEITACYNSRQAKRLHVKPGLTGYAQINGRSEINHGQKIEYDLYYVENRSFLFDMKILLATVKYVVMGKGAY